MIKQITKGCVPIVLVGIPVVAFLILLAVNMFNTWEYVWGNIFSILALAGSVVVILSLEQFFLQCKKILFRFNSILQSKKISLRLITKILFRYVCAILAIISLVAAVVLYNNAEDIFSWYSIIAHTILFCTFFLAAVLMKD